MRTIRKIIIHCSDSDIPAHDDIVVIDQWHKERGWRGVGYHYFIRSTGAIQRGRSDEEVGAHCSGQNGDSLGICLHGRHNFTKEQFISLRKLIEYIKGLYGHIAIFGHREFESKKTCPNFDWREKLTMTCNDPKDEKRV